MENVKITWNNAGRVWWAYGWRVGIFVFVIREGRSLFTEFVLPSLPAIVAPVVGTLTTALLVAGSIAIMKWWVLGKKFRRFGEEFTLELVRENPK